MFGMSSSAPKAKMTKGCTPGDFTSSKTAYSSSQRSPDEEVQQTGSRHRVPHPKEDARLYALQLHVAEDCLFSMSTLAHKPFNLDKPFNLNKPIPDPGLNPGKYNRLLVEHRWMSNYGFRKDGYFN